MSALRLAAALLLLSAPCVAAAQAADDKPASKKARQAGVITIDALVVEGRIQKPEAFYILQPTNLNYEAAELEDSFLPELYRTVRHEPF